MSDEWAPAQDALRAAALREGQSITVASRGRLVSPEPKAWLCQYDGFGVHKRSQHHPGDEPLFTRAAILAPILALHQDNGWGFCDGCFRPDRTWQHAEWPCPTARAAGVSATARRTEEKR